METERGEENNVYGIDGLKPVEASAVERIERGMTEEVIPEIIRIVEERRTLAAESRLWQLKC
ncbi:hypothetical protein NITMOv2_4843 [Nitrospira moscoviensis]|uniref:Uncharacterized protein n=1 Tax=Nitrospira moscoviensis TaxID=42253 RepID=A0A0K2GJU4_NITMO|nr:hypothetical protein NITMOv2_4843 [Nitrospira moscoviensis]